MDIKAITIAVKGGNTLYLTQQERAQILNEYDLRLDAWPEIDGAPAPLDSKILLWLEAHKYINNIDRQVKQLSNAHTHIDTTDLQELRSFIAQCQRIITLVNNDTIQNSKIIYK